MLAHTHTHTLGRRFKAGVRLKNGFFKRASFTVILFCSLLLTSSCEDDFSETEIEQKEAGTTFKLQPRTFSQNAGSTMEDLLVLEQFLATRSDLLAQNPFDANWGSFDTSRSVKVEVSPSLTTTTFKITPNLINDRYFTNVVVTKLDGEIKKVVYSSYLYSQAFYDKYHNNGEHMSKFSGYNLQQSVLDLMNNSTCSEFAFFYVPEEGDILSGGAGDGPPGFYTNTNNPNHNENLADFTNAWSNSNWAPPGGGSSGNGSGESNGDNTISTVIGVVGDAVGGAASSVGTWFGDSWQSIKRWFRNLWCNCGGTNRFAENFTGTEPGNLIIYTEPVDANEPITDPCDRILMGILADEYSPQHISDFLGISLADLNYLMKQEHLQFFINSLSLLYESSFSTNAINHFHEALQDYKDSQNPITDLEFVYSSFDDMLEKDAQKQNVIDFLVQNNYSDEAFAFLREAMPALQDNDGDGQPDAEVDWEEKIISKLVGKEKCLDEHLKESGNNFVQDLLANFEGDDSEFGIDIRSKDQVFYKDENGNTTEVNGKTIYTSTSNIIKIEISTSKANSNRALEVVKTLLHEYIHADIFRKLNIQPPSNDDLIFRDTYNSFKDNNFEPSPEHETMAALYVNSMKEALKSYHMTVMTGDYNYLSNNGQIDLDNFYEALAWQGLKHHDVQAWQDMPENQKDVINDAYQQYIFASTHNCPN